LIEFKVHKSKREKQYITVVKEKYLKNASKAGHYLEKNESNQQWRHL